MPSRQLRRQHFIPEITLLKGLLDMNELATPDRDALLAAIHRATLSMKRATGEGAFETAMTRLGRLLHERRLERRYNPHWPSQPRMPRGNPGGGQWTDGGASGGEVLQPSVFAEAVSDEPVQTAAKISPALEQECLEQYERDTFFCTMIRNRACHAQAPERYAACLAGRPIPPLNF